MELGRPSGGEAERHDTGWEAASRDCSLPTGKRRCELSELGKATTLSMGPRLRLSRGFLPAPLPDVVMGLPLIAQP